MSKDSDLADTIRALVSLFPGQQHRKCSEWLKGNLVSGSVSSEIDARPRVMSRSLGRDERTNQRVGARPPSTPAPQTSSGQIKVPARNVQKPPYQARVSPPPPFAQEITADASVWGDRVVVGKGLSWDEERRLLEKFEKLAGFSDAAPGFIGGMITLLKEHPSPTGKVLHVELYIPRVSNPKSVLIAIGRDAGHKRQFEVATSDISPANIQKLVQLMEAR